VKHHTPDVIVLNLTLQADLQLIPELISQCNAKIICLAGTENTADHDNAVVKGARGILTKNETPDQLLKAIECVHRGELWINRDATSRILMEIAKANTPKPESKDQTLLTSLTKRELHVYSTVTASSDKTLKEISGLLHTSEHTLRNHLASIYSKLGVTNRLELYVFSNRASDKTNS
jgi:DNA-binding NarL/FixJ family response regulator